MQQNMGKKLVEWNTDWLNTLDFDKVDIMPLQFANVARIEKNDAIFLFDEVGTGKTISSGLAVRHYLHNYPDKKALIITTPSMAGDQGQFLTTWKDKLGFDRLSDRVRCINNIYSNLRVSKDENIGIVVIDEAHTFLNEGTRRFKCLTNMFGGSKEYPEKVILMTATPIKSTWEGDKETYKKIVKALLKRDYPNSEKGEQDPFELLKVQEEKNLICKVVNVKCPVTRYFKETFEYLKRDDKNAEYIPVNIIRRAAAERWRVDDEHSEEEKKYLPENFDMRWEKKKAKLLVSILKRWNEDNANHFLVFARYVEAKDGVEEIAQFFQDVGGFKKWKQDQPQEKPTYYTVTGENRGDLRYFNPPNGKKDDMPTVLIVNNVAEAGVDLQNFNWVIHYNISAFPSTLEQRWGRIDRFGSPNKEIHVAFVLESGDCDAINHHWALNFFGGEIVDNIPSRNVILTDEEMLNGTGSLFGAAESWLGEIKRMSEDSNELKKIHKRLLKQYPEEKDNGEDFWEEFYEFCRDRRDVGKLEIPDELKEFRKNLKELLEEYTNPERIRVTMQERERIKSIARDGIFYKAGEEIKPIDAEECATAIKESQHYKEIKNWIRDVVYLFEILRKEELLKFLNDKIKEGSGAEVLFPYDGNRRNLARLLPKENMEEHIKQGYYKNEEERECILQHADIVIENIDFYRKLSVVRSLWLRHFGSHNIETYGCNEELMMVKDEKGILHTKEFYYMFADCMSRPVNPDLHEIWRQRRQNCVCLMEKIGDAYEAGKTSEFFENVEFQKLKKDIGDENKELEQGLYNTHFHKIVKKIAEKEFRRINSLGFSPELWDLKNGDALDTKGISVDALRVLRVVGEYLRSKQKRWVYRQMPDGTWEETDMLYDPWWWRKHLQSAIERFEKDYHLEGHREITELVSPCFFGIGGDYNIEWYTEHS